MLGHKHMLSREGGIEIVVCELATRMSKLNGTYEGGNVGADYSNWYSSYG